MSREQLRLCSVCGLMLWLIFTQTTAELPICKESDYHFEYTECDILGSRWRVAVPNKADTCTDLPDPVKGTHCTFSCNEGEFLDMQSQQCQKCAAGTYSLGTGVAFEDWDSLPTGFVTRGVMTSEEHAFTDCSNSTWKPKGDHVASNTDECTATLSYAIKLKKPGILSFEYFYSDSSIYFEFFVQNDKCQSTDSETRWMKISVNDWSQYQVDLSNGNNVLFWRTTMYALQTSAVKPVLVKNIQISGVAYTSECFHCKPGTHSAKAGAARCLPCPSDTYSNKGATVCHQCEQDKYAEPGSGTCKPRPACTTSDYFYTHTPCDSEGQTQLMYKWIEPKFCSETLEEAVKLPASGEKQTCPPCNPGFFITNTSACDPCSTDSYSNGTICKKCPVGTEPVMGFEYKWWNTMPTNMKSSVFSQALTDSSRRTAWEVAGEYVYTTPGDRDTDYLMLTLTVPGYRMPQSMVKENERKKLSSITFVFETMCTADCNFYFMAGYNEWNNNIVEHWRGTTSKQSYSYLIESNSTIGFTWTFQRAEKSNMERKYEADFAKIYSIHITNVLGGVASQCHRCALASVKADSTCVPCPPGQYMVSATGMCKSCPSNAIIRTSQFVGDAACVQCGPNTKRNDASTACLSDCKLDIQTPEGTSLQYDFTSLSNITGFDSSPRFTNKGLRYFQHFNMVLCGTESRVPATCVDNVTESGRVVKGYICQSTVVPSDRTQSVVSSQPFLIGDSLIGLTTQMNLDDILSPEWLFPASTGMPDVIFYYKSSDTTQACKQGRSATIRLRCNPAITAKDQISLPSNCSEGTCDGCAFHFLWQSQNACPLCTNNHYREIVSACIKGIQKTTYVWQQPQQCYGGESLPAQKLNTCVTLDFWLKFGVSTGAIAAAMLVSISCYFWKKTRKLQFKYSKLMMSSGGKECELPTAESCAIMEGEDAEDDLMEFTKKSFFTKIKGFSRERTSDGFDSVPLKSTSMHQLLDDESSDDA